MTDRLSKVRAVGLTKVFDHVRALTRVSFEISSGDVVAIMGPNGAGKSTLIGILSLRTRPTRGQLLYNDTKIEDLSYEVTGNIGLLSHQPLIYPDLSCRENLIFFAKLGGVTDPKSAVSNAERQFGIENFAADRPARVLSRGQLQRASLARALLSKPDLLLLDEPAAGLDAEAIDRVDGAVKQLVEQGGMAVIVTHEPEVAARIASRAIMMNHGKITFDDISPNSVQEWKTLYRDSMGGQS